MDSGFSWLGGRKAREKLVLMAQQLDELKSELSHAYTKEAALSQGLEESEIRSQTTLESLRLLGLENEDLKSKHAESTQREQKLVHELSKASAAVEEHKLAAEKATIELEIKLQSERVIIVELAQKLKESSQEIAAMHSQIDELLRELKHSQQTGSQLAADNTTLQNQLSVAQTLSVSLQRKLDGPNVSQSISAPNLFNPMFLASNRCIDSNMPKHHIIVPIHSPKITHISNMFSNLKEADGDIGDTLITFVATTSEEKYVVDRYISLISPNIPLFCEVISATELCDEFSYSELKLSIKENRNNANINVKKILALYRAMLKGAEEVVILDVDVVFFKHPSVLFHQARGNFAKKMFFAAHPTSDLMREIVCKSADYFSPHDKYMIMEIMDYAKMYSWFFDVPFYPRCHALQFISHISSLHGGAEEALLALSWHSFDYLIFMYFLMLSDDFKIIDVRSLVSEARATDSFSLKDIGKIEFEFGYKPVWAPLPSIISDHQTKGGALDFVLAIHSDRVS